MINCRFRRPSVAELTRGLSTHTARSAEGCAFQHFKLFKEKNICLRSPRLEAPAMAQDIIKRSSAAVLKIEQIS